MDAAIYIYMYIIIMFLYLLAEFSIMGYEIQDTDIFSLIDQIRNKSSVPIVF